MNIKYEFLTGETLEIEVSDDIGRASIELDREIYNRNRRETRRHTSVETIQEQGIQIPDQSVGIVTLLERQETYEALYIVMDKLLPQQRKLIREVFFEGKSIAQIAREEGVSESAIRDRLNRIYQHMKKLLAF